MEEVSESYEEIQKNNLEYQNYIDEITPKHSLPKQLCRAFIMGGLICMIGQLILNMGMQKFGLEQADAAIWCSIILILLSDILTGFGIYPRIVKWGGAGALVPITGFANSISSAAIEYKKEGWVFGVGCKIFTIAGPVILYGIFISWVLGILYMIVTKTPLF